MNTKYKNIIFDFDGTLVDTAPDIINCLKKAFYEVLKIKNMNIHRDIIGPPVNVMIGKLRPDLDAETVEALTKSFRICYDKSIFPDTYLYDGVKELLIALKGMKYKIFVVTNKPMLPTKKILKKLDIDFFDKVITVDYLKETRLTKSEMIKCLISEKYIDSKKSLVVGDTQGDIDAAKENSIDSVAVLYGYGNEIILLKCKPTIIVKSASVLMSYL